MTILFCPVCCSPTDVPERNGVVREVCTVCGTTFEVDVDLDTLARHSVV